MVGDPDWRREWACVVDDPECGPDAWCPCRQIAGEGIRVCEVETRLRGWYDATLDVINVRQGLDHARHRSTLAHELVHADLREARPPRLWEEMQQERRARILAARDLIRLRDLAVALAESVTEREAARRLDVDVATLRRRVGTLTDEERQYVELAIDRYAA